MSEDSGLSGYQATVRIRDVDQSWDEAAESGAYEDVAVFDHVTVSQEHFVGVGEGHETFNTMVVSGSGGLAERPDAITRRVAKILFDEFGITWERLDLEGIRVVDVDPENVRQVD